MASATTTAMRAVRATITCTHTNKHTQKTPPPPHTHTYTYVYYDAPLARLALILVHKRAVVFDL